MDNAQVDLTVGLDEVVLNVFLQNETGGPLDLASPTFQYADRAGIVFSFAIPQVGVGQYQLRFDTPPEGAYRGTVTYATSNGQRDSAAPFVVNYPAEWRPGDAKLGLENLLRWAELTGGGQVDFGVEQVSADPDMQDDFGFIDVLLLALVVLWPLEIAVRRRKMPWV